MAETETRATSEGTRLEPGLAAGETRRKSHCTVGATDLPWK